MLSKVLFFICLSMVFQCALLTSTKAKQKADKWIEQTLYERRPIERCATISKYKFKTPAYDQSGDPAWTVVILKIEQVGQKTLYMQHCTGSLIGLGVVLTAASCVQEMDNINFIVRAGDWSQPRAGCQKHIQEHDIKEIVTPKSYAGYFLDIALLFLVKPFSDNCYVNTVCIAPQRVESQLNNVQCSITGWEHHRTGLAGYLRFTRFNATVVSKNRCTAVLRNTSLGGTFKLADDSMCGVIKSDPDLLLGSGGAPMVCQVCDQRKMFIQFGVLSYGFETAVLPSVLTSVSKYNSWIVGQCQQRGYQLRTC